MTTRNISKQLLTGTSTLTLAAMIALPSSSASAAAWNQTITTSSTTQSVAAANNDALTVGNGTTGDLAVAGAIAALNTGGFSGTTITVNTADTSHGIASTGNFSAIKVDQTVAGSSLTSLTNTRGLITGAGTGASTATVYVDNVNGSTLTLNNTANGIISNTGSGGSVFNFAPTTAGGTYNVTNAGTISSTGGNNNAFDIGAHAATVAITNTGTITTAGSGKVLNVGAAASTVGFTNSGTVNGGTGGISIGNGVTATISNTAGTLNAGPIALGNQAGSSLSVSGGTVTGAVSGTGSVTVSGGALTGAVSNTGALTVSGGTLTGAVTNTSTVTLSGGQVVGTIDGATAITSSANYVSNGNIGATTAVTSLAITGGSTFNAATNNNSIRATNVTLATGTTLNLGTGAVTGAIDGTGGANLGTVNFGATQTTGGALGTTNGLLAVNVNNGAVVTLGGDIKATTTAIANGGTLNLGGTARTITGNMTDATSGTLNIGTAAHTLTGTLTTGATTSVIKASINSGTADASGKLTANTFTFTGGGPSVVVDTSNVSSFIANNTTYTILTGTNAATAPTSVTGTTNFLTWAGDTTTVGSLKVKATRAATYQGVATTTNNQAVGTVLTALGNNADTNISAFQGRLDGTTTTAQADLALKEVTPQVNATSVQAISSTGQSLDVIDNRLEQLRAGIDNSTGMNAGSADAKSGWWIQGFGTTATQDLRNGVDGYDADSVGVSVGADTLVDTGTRIGVSGSYANSSVDSTGTANQKTDIDSWQANVYASYTADRWYTDALAGFAYQQYDSQRFITSPAVVAGGDFDGQTYTGRIGAGYRLLSGILDVTPNGSLTYYYNRTEGYTETGAGGLNLHVNDHNDDALIGRFGADIGRSFGFRSFTIRPVIRGAYLYDFMDDQVSTTSYFTGGGATFRTSDASPERSAYTFGGSLNIMSAGRLTLSADYDYLAKSGYDSHSGMVRARYDF